MLPAIEFDDQFQLEADKVSDVRSYRVLTAKFCSLKSSVPEQSPERFLRVCLPTAQCTGGGYFLAFAHYGFGDHGAGIRVLFSWRRISGNILGRKACHAALFPSSARRLARSS